MPFNSMESEIVPFEMGYKKLNPAALALPVVQPPGTFTPVYFIVYPFGPAMVCEIRLLLRQV